MLHECLACERVFTMGRDGNTGVPIEYASTYCTHECYEQFEAQLKAEVERANIAELNPEGTPVATTDESLRKIIGAFNFKVSSK